MRHILGISNIYTTNYQPQTNGQPKSFNRTLLAALRHYVPHHPRTWDEFTDAVTCVNNIQPHSGTGFAPFALILALAPPTLSIEARPDIIRGRSSRQWYLQWKQRLEAQIKTFDNQIRKAQTQYKRHFDTRRRRTNDEVNFGDSFFIEEALVYQSHKLAPIATGHLPVVALNTQSVRIQRIQNSVKNMSHNCIQKLAPRMNATTANQNLSSTTILVFLTYPVFIVLKFLLHTDPLLWRRPEDIIRHIRRPRNVTSQYRKFSCYRPR